MYVQIISSSSAKSMHFKVKGGMVPVMDPCLCPLIDVAIQGSEKELATSNHGQL